MMLEFENKDVMKFKLAPVVIFVYARPEHAMETIESLASNYHAQDTDVYIYSDAAKNEDVESRVEQVRSYIDSLTQMKLFKTLTINKAETNKGLAESIITGVSEIIEEYGRVIVVEDDLVSSVDFLQFMNDALNYYEADSRIWSICGYTFKIKFPLNYKHDLYLSHRGGSWGWATWKDRWANIDWEVSDYPDFKHNKKMRRHFNRGGLDMSRMLDSQMQGKIDSWAIRWCYAQSKINKLTVYPTVSRIQNIGLDGTGSHCGVTTKYDSFLSDGTVECKMENIDIDKRVMKSYRDHFGTRYAFLLRDVKKLIKKMLKI